MILRRLKAHVEKENWFAVGIDFLIVVVGVFIGIQVANWNAASVARSEGQILLQRLSEDVNILHRIQQDEYAYHLPRSEGLAAVHGLIFNQDPGRSLTDLECRKIGISHWLPAPTDELPILEEAIATGRIDLIENDTVKASLRRFAILRDRSRRQYEEAINELYRLASRHPESIWYIRVRSRSRPDDASSPGAETYHLMRRPEEDFRFTHDCDLDEMRRSRTFQADYVDNVARLNSYIDRYRQIIDATIDLKGAIAFELEGGSAAPMNPEVQ